MKSVDYSPRGRIVTPLVTVAIGGAEMSGRVPGIIVYVRSRSGRLMGQFHAHTLAAGIAKGLIEDGHGDAWECVGDPAALAALIDHPAVIRWHYPLSARPPFRASGAGSGDTDGARRAVFYARLPKREKRAVDERDRRALLTPAQRGKLARQESRDVTAALA